MTSVSFQRRCKNTKKVLIKGRELFILNAHEVNVVVDVVSGLLCVKCG